MFRSFFCLLFINTSMVYPANQMSQDIILTKDIITLSFQEGQSHLTQKGIITYIHPHGLKKILRNPHAQEVNLIIPIKQTHVIAFIQCKAVPEKYVTFLTVQDDRNMTCYRLEEKLLLFLRTKYKPDGISTFRLEHQRSK